MARSGEVFSFFSFSHFFSKEKTVWGAWMHWCVFQHRLLGTAPVENAVGGGIVKNVNLPKDSSSGKSFFHKFSQWAELSKVENKKK